MVIVNSANRTFQSLCDALGVEGEEVTRIVIDVQIDCIPKLYVERYVTAEAMESLTHTTAKPGDKVVEVGEIEIDKGDVKIRKPRGAEITDEQILAILDLTTVREDNAEHHPNVWRDEPRGGIPIGKEKELIASVRKILRVGR